MKYTVQVRVSGYVNRTVSAESEDDAVALACESVEDSCGTTTLDELDQLEVDANEVLRRA